MYVGEGGALIADGGGQGSYLTLRYAGVDYGVGEREERGEARENDSRCGVTQTHTHLHTHTTDAVLCPRPSTRARKTGPSL